MGRKRTEMMEKARAKHSRREASRQRKKGGAATDNAPTTGEGLPEKVIDLTQEALDQIESLVKTTSKKIKEVVGPPPPSQLSKGS